MTHHCTINPTLFDSWTLLDGGGLIRSAGEEDVNDILRVLRRQAGEASLYQLDAGEVLARIDEFLVASDGKGETVGCVALRRVSDEVAEIASLAVVPTACGAGIGPALVQQCLKLAAARGFSRAWLATQRPGYFRRIGFSPFPVLSLPPSVQWRKLMAVFRQPVGRWRHAFDGSFVFLEREVSGRFGLVRDRGGASTAQAQTS
jgi:amino-acid N-acetyltransferase